MVNPTTEDGSVTTTMGDHRTALGTGRGLITRLARDVAAAFPDVIVAHQDGIYSGVLRMVPTRHDAEDITQETFIRAYRALLGYDPDRIGRLALRPWLWSIALNLCRNAARDRSRRAVTVPLIDDDRATRDTVDVAAEGIEAVVAREWQQRLDSLTTSQRDAIVLRHVVGLPYAEIATALDRPVGTTKADVHRGLERLRSLLAIETEETP
jgi:RNA polymerase sigma-70 factor (ECF subfamily)